MNNKKIENEILMHRYLYYVLGTHILPDFEYDKLERAAREILPEDSVVHRVGSSNPWDYGDDIKAMVSGVACE